MSFDLGDFDATHITPRKPPGPVPTGKYAVVITNSELKDTSNPHDNHKRLELTYEIAKGEYKGRKLWSSHNLINSNPDTVRIAKEELASICHAVGVMRPGNISKLYGLIMLAGVRYLSSEDPNNPASKPRNEITYYEKYDPSAGGVPPQPSQTTAVGHSVPPVQQPFPQQAAPPAQQQPAGNWWDQGK